MCGRFTLTLDPGELQDAFPQFSFPKEVAPRFNIAPTQPILVLPNDGTNQADFFIWGLIPSWAKEPSLGSRLINARAETLAEKPAFRSAYRHHRCLIFSDGFYEWQTRPGSKSKIPHHIRLKSGRPFTLAGLWEQCQSPDGTLIKSATIITTEPNALISNLHNRMPVILPIQTYAQWLDPSPGSVMELQKLLVAYPAAEMTGHPVSSRINNPSYDYPDCILPA